MLARDEAFEKILGLFNIALTPFDGNGAIDPTALEANIVRALDAGCQGILIGGTYGEFPAMTPGERAGLFRVAADIVGARAPVIVGTADMSPRVALELTGLAAELGALPMMMPPFVSEVREDHIVAFFRAVTDRSAVGVMIYNAPGIGITLSPALLERLAAELPGIVGVKQGDLAPRTVDDLCGRLLGRVRLIAASDLAMLGPLAAGFDGLSSTNSSALPEAILAAYAAMQRGDAGQAGRIHRAWYPIRDCIRRFGQPQTTKALMTLRGWYGGTVRPPLQSLDSDELATLSGAWERTRAMLDGVDARMLRAA